MSYGITCSQRVLSYTRSANHAAFTGLGRLSGLIRTFPEEFEVLVFAGGRCTGFDCGGFFAGAFDILDAAAGAVFAGAFTGAGFTAGGFEAADDGRALGFGAAADGFDTPAGVFGNVVAVVGFFAGAPGFTAVFFGAVLTGPSAAMEFFTPFP